MRIRPEELADRTGVRAIHRAAFPTAAEADLVAALRDQARPLVSLVAEEGHAIVGHIVFSPVTLLDHPGLVLMGLAPMAVIPARQRAGIGTALVRAGLEACGRLGVDGVVVLGHPRYYARFGFVPGVRRGLGCEYDVQADAFMVLPLRAEALRGVAGTIRYHAAFARL